MYLTTLDPISRDFDRIVRRAFGGNTVGYAPALPMDTVRRDGEVVLRFDVTVDKGVLTVSATREETKTEGENPVVRR
jgi:HSP20 family protein